MQIRQWGDPWGALDTPHGVRHPPVIQDITYHCKTPLNIDIYPSTLFFFLENIGHKYDFEGGRVVWSLVGSGGGGVVVQLQGNKPFPPNKFIFTYYGYLQ